MWERVTIGKTRYSAIRGRRVPAGSSRDSRHRTIRRNGRWSFRAFLCKSSCVHSHTPTHGFGLAGGAERGMVFGNTRILPRWGYQNLEGWIWNKHTARFTHPFQNPDSRGLSYVVCPPWLYTGQPAGTPSGRFSRYTRVATSFPRRWRRLNPFSIRSWFGASWAGRATDNSAPNVAETTGGERVALDFRSRVQTPLMYVMAYL